MISTAGAKFLLIVLLGPVAAAYDFLTNPNAPPQIFVAQWNGSFPNHPIEPRPAPKLQKRITISRP